MVENIYGLKEGEVIVKNMFNRIFDVKYSNLLFIRGRVL